MDISLTCTVNIEWQNKDGIIQKKFSNKQANLRLIRNETKAMFIEVSSEKSAPIRLALKGVTVHNKFMNQGKASIKFQSIYCHLYLSNAPPGALQTLLRTMFVKMTGDKPVATTPKSSGNRLTALTNNKGQFDEISPVTNIELEKARKKALVGKGATPSPLASKKRKVGSRDSAGDSKAPAAKKLYAGSPGLNEPLTLEQTEVLNACLAGHNVFFTGSAGTGKSYLLRKIIRALPPDVTTATASTGVAACHVGGITLHQFAGIGTGEASIERCVALASKNPTSVQWRKCKHLIIDEISMLDGEYFEKIEEVARQVRRNDKPFGGIQIILCGDFLQLPPVSKNKSTKTLFCFQSKAWSNCRLRSYVLKQVHRQTDGAFVEILNKIRIGRVDEMVIEAMRNTAKQQIEQDGILATRLCTHTRDADLINENKLGALSGDVVVYEAQDSVQGDSRSMLEQQTPAPGRLELKVGAQVMLLKNINVSQGLVNGARGVIKLIRDGLPLVQFRNNREYLAKHERWVVKTSSGGIMVRQQLPLKLAWAFSIHKAQGLTLDCVEISLGRVFESGQSYVALSRAQSLQTLRVLNFNPNQVWANPVVLEFYKRLDDTRLISLGRDVVANKEERMKIIKRLIGKSKGGKLSDKPLVNIS